MNSMDFVKDINPRVVRDVFLEIEKKINKDGFQISEYEVQSTIVRSINDFARNTGLEAIAEREGKRDLIIRNAESGPSPIVIAEIKTYLKNNEFPENKQIESDIKKTAKYIIQHPVCRGFIYICIRKSKINDSGLKFIHLHFAKSRKHHLICEIEGKKIFLRPSSAQRGGRSVLLSWEIVIK